jgi:hypothetical protein
MLEPNTDIISNVSTYECPTCLNLPICYWKHAYKTLYDKQAKGLLLQINDLHCTCLNYDHFNHS